MAYRCDSCDKGRMVGKQHKHHPGVAGGRWKKSTKNSKIFRPNLHVYHLPIGTTKKKVKLCTKCLRRAKEAVLQIREDSKLLLQSPLAV